MNANLKSKLAALPLLALSTVIATAGPIALDTTQMDRVTAGSQPILERIANLLIALPQVPGGQLNVDQLTSLTQIAALEMVSFQQLNTGELVATHQLASGEKLVFIKPLSDVDPALLRQVTPGESVTTYLLKPGDTLRIQQISSGGANNRLFVYSPGSSVTSIQKAGF